MRVKDIDGSLAVHHQRRHPHLCYFLGERLSIHRIPLFICARTERASTKIPPEMIQEVRFPNHRFLTRRMLNDNPRGVPYYCIGFTAAFYLLAYMACSSGANKVFVWFQNLVTTACLFTWMSISIAYIKFHAAMKAQGVDRSTLVFHSPYQPYMAYFSLVFFAVMTFFNGFYSFGPFDAQGFVTSYVGIPIYFGLYISWKFFKKTMWLGPREADITSGKAAMDAADAHWPERKPRNVIERICFWIA